MAELLIGTEYIDDTVTVVDCTVSISINCCRTERN